MCGRFVDPNLRSEGLDTSELKIDPFARRRYNVKPTDGVFIISKDNFYLARWWLIPSWFKGDDPKEWKATTFNARYEDAAEKPSFRGAWKYGRCLIPAGGYYEWTGEKGRKQPWFIAPKSNEADFYFAGLFTHWAGIETCTILTREANASIDHVHTRMPVIPNLAEREAWLAGEDDPNLGAGVELEAYPVRRFGLHDEGAELIEPYEA